MAIFINWFETKMEAVVQNLPCRRFSTWEDWKQFSKTAPSIHHNTATIKDYESKTGGVIAVLINASDGVLEDFVEEPVNLHEMWQVGCKVTDYNLGKYFEGRDFRVKHAKFASSATTPAFKVPALGLMIETGISYKAHFVKHAQKLGVTLDWKVGLFCENSLDQFPRSMDSVLHGITVLLKQGVANEVDEEIRECEGRYLGKIVTLQSGGDVEILCRDGVRRNLAREFLLPEPRLDILTQLSKGMPEFGSGESLAKKVQVLSHAMTSGGRRNIRVLQDKLKAALTLIDPGNRPFVIMDLAPPCQGRMKLSLHPAVAKIEDRPYV